VLTVYNLGGEAGTSASGCVGVAVLSSGITYPLHKQVTNDDYFWARERELETALEV
jgi:hypothetical protein